MNVFAVWLGACRKIREALFASKGAGTQFEAKSVKKNEIPQKGQFNIMVSYNQRNLLNRKREVKKIFFDSDSGMNVLDLRDSGIISAPLEFTYKRSINSTV